MSAIRSRRRAYLFSTLSLSIVKFVYIACLISVWCKLGGNAHQTLSDGHHYNRDRQLTGNIGSGSRSASSSACIGDDSSFRNAVAKASTDPKKPATVITLCARVKISDFKDPNSNITGIDMSGKNIDLKCYNPKGNRCVVDGQRSSRIVHGSATFLRATNIDFINAYVPLGETSSDYSWYQGSAMSFKIGGDRVKSKITLIRCSFRNNRNENLQGGTVHISFSHLTLSGSSTSPVVFSNNYAYYGSALYLVKANFTVRNGNVLFTNNVAEYTGGAVRLYDSDAKLRGVTFSYNRAEDVGALLIESGRNTTLEDVDIMNNEASNFYGGVLISDSKVDFKGVRFIGNSAGEFAGLVTRDAVANLKNCTFFKNKVKKNKGADIHILDNDRPKDGGSFVSCKETTFWNGALNDRILDYPGVKNTDCIEKGIIVVPSNN